MLVLAGSFAADPAAAATAGGCYVWQGQVTINLQDQYWIALRSNPRVTGPGSPVLFAHVQDNCYATARFGANGRVQWIPSAYSVGVNSGVYSGPSRSAVSAQVYGTRWVAAKHVYTRAAQPLFQMAVAPYDSSFGGSGTVRTTYPSKGGTNVTMTGTLAAKASETFTPHQAGATYVNEYYCQQVAATKGVAYYLDNAYTPQQWPAWSAVWPTESTEYTVIVGKSTTLKELPDASILTEIRSQLGQNVTPNLLVWTWDPSTITELDGGNKIGTEVVQFGSMDSRLPEPWNMTNASSC